MINQLLARLMGLSEAEVTEGLQFSKLLSACHKAFRPLETAPAGSTEYEEAAAAYSKTTNDLCDFIHSFRTRAIRAENVVARQAETIKRLQAQIDAGRTDPALGEKLAAEGAKVEALDGVTADDKQFVRDMLGDDVPQVLKDILADPRTKVLRLG